MAKRTAIIFGSTGTQGRAVVRSLTTDGWSVTAVTRHPVGGAAAALADMGAKLVSSPVDDLALARLIEGMDLTVSIQPALTDRWNSLEAIEGMRIATAAKAAGVGHFIQHSAIVADAHGILGMGSKRAIEERIAELGLAATILRPAFFMENLLTYFPLKRSSAGWTLAAPLPLDRPTEMVAAADIGRAVAAVARDPSAHAGRSYDLIGDSQSLAAAAKAIADALGEPVEAVALPAAALAEAWPQGVPLFSWIIARGTRGDSSLLKTLVSTPTDFRDWARSNLAPTLANASAA